MGTIVAGNYRGVNLFLRFAVTRGVFGFTVFIAAYVLSEREHDMLLLYLDNMITVHRYTRLTVKQ